MPECMITHTDYDPPIEEFNCPKCGQKHGRKFGITDEGGVGEYGCSKLHLWDYLDCAHCGWKGHGDEWVKLMGNENEPTEWTVEYTTRQIGPFTLSVRRQIDGEFNWTVCWKQASTALANGKQSTHGDAQQEAEDAVENWIEEAQGDLE